MDPDTITLSMLLNPGGTPLFQGVLDDTDVLAELAILFLSCDLATA